MIVIKELTARTKRRVGGTTLGRRLLKPLWRRLNRSEPAAKARETPPAPKAEPPVPEPQVYRGYDAEDLAVFEAFPPVDGTPEPGFVVDFLGVRTRVAYFPLKHVDGKVLGHPLPLGDSFHAEAVEYVGLLKSVLAATGRFVALELGAGWGPWLIGGAAAARRRGISEIRLYGIEADPAHFVFLQTHFGDNGFDPETHTLIQGAVGVTPGRARWPKVADPSADWGSRPLDNDLATIDYLGRSFDEFIDIEMYAFDNLLEREPSWDLVHIDVQGSEAELCRASAELLDRRVRFVVVGTHSRKLDGDLMDHFFRRGWVLENEKPARFTFDPALPTLEAMTYRDGTQVWRNPRL